VANPDDARFLQRYFKTGPGEYGEGDRFIGVRVPALRAIVRDLRGASVSDATALLRSGVHEERLLGLLLLAQAYGTADAKGRTAIYRAYLDHTRYINNWDLVDASAPLIVGRHLESRNRRVLMRLARSRLLWERRIAMVATYHFIKQRDYADAIAIATVLLGDEHDLMHKAAGWMLREVGKRDVGTLRAFLDRHAPDMPRTMLRYAIERLPEGARHSYMGVRMAKRPTKKPAAAPAAAHRTRSGTEAVPPGAQEDHTTERESGYGGKGANPRRSADNPRRGRPQDL
jgi:3-methyladenine DNA glycosylase AlkD